MQGEEETLKKAFEQSEEYRVAFEAFKAKQ